MSRRRQAAAGPDDTRLGQDVVDSVTHMGKAGHIADFWSLVASGFSDPEEFKASVIKDCEVLSVVGALFLTIAFQLLFTDTNESPVHLHVAFAISANASLAFSLLSCLVAVRTLLMVNAAPGTATLSLLRSVERRRGSKWYLNTYNLSRLAAASLLAASVLLSCIKYDWKMMFIAALGSRFALFYYMREDEFHTMATMEYLTRKS